MDPSNPISVADDATPKSFFFHSPPDSPVQLPPPSVNPFSQFADVLVHRGGKHVREKRSSSRPNTSDGTYKANGHLKSASISAQEPESSWQLDADPFASTPPPSSNRYTTFSTLSHPNVALTSSSPSNISHKKRPGSQLLSNTADILFSRSRRKATRTAAPTPLQSVSLAEEVLDISSDLQTRLLREREEVEERERLRDEAARSIGLNTLSPDNLQETNEIDSSSPSPIQEEERNKPPNLPSASPRTSEKLLPKISAEQLSDSSDYTGSAAFSSRLLSTAENITPIPSFPSTYGGLSSYILHTAVLPRYILPHSALTHLLSRSRSWKSRLIALSSFPGSVVPFSFVHIFKNPIEGQDNPEIDRLEITEDTVVYVGDQEVGGRKHVLRIGGLHNTDGNMPDRLPPTSVQNIHSMPQSMDMWFVHVADPSEMQKWLSAIKTIVLNKRAETAGLSAIRETQSSRGQPGPRDIYNSSNIPTQRIPVQTSLPPISPISPLRVDLSLASGGDLLPPPPSDTISRRPSRISKVSAIRGFFSSTSLIQSSSQAKSGNGSIKKGRQLLDHESGVPHRNLRQNIIGNGHPLISKPFPSPLSAHFESIDNDNDSISVMRNPSITVSDPVVVPVVNEQRIESHDPVTQRRSVSGRSLDDVQHLAALSISTKTTDTTIASAEFPSTATETIQSTTPDSAPILDEKIANLSSAPLDPGRGSVNPERNLSGGRMRLSTALPEMLAPPSGPLPPPPINNIDEAKSRRESVISQTSTRFSKRVSNPSGAGTLLGRPANSNRLSTLLFSNKAGRSPARMSMPPPPRPPPSFAPPAPPASAGHSSSSFSRKHLVRLHHDAVPPTTLPPSGPLPPIPLVDRAESTDRTNTIRLRRISEPSPASLSSVRTTRIAHPFGPRENSAGFATPNGDLDAGTLTNTSTMIARRHLSTSDYGNEPMVAALSPPPRRHSTRPRPVAYVQSRVEARKSFVKETPSQAAGIRSSESVI